MAERPQRAAAARGRPAETAVADQQTGQMSTLWRGTSSAAA
ncbi:hypothetical protein ABZ840_30455 [Streptomyces sp. NPDC047117]